MRGFAFLIIGITYGKRIWWNTTTFDDKTPETELIDLEGLTVVKKTHRRRLFSPDIMGSLHEYSPFLFLLSTAGFRVRKSPCMQVTEL